MQRPWGVHVLGHLEVWLEQVERKKGSDLTPGLHHEASWMNSESKRGTGGSEHDRPKPEGAPDVSMCWEEGASSPQGRGRCWLHSSPSRTC